MKTHLFVTALAASLILSGCSTAKGLLGKRDDGSLDYQSSQKLDPIQLPQGQATAEFTPLYPTPNSSDNTLDLTNDSGKQYRLPPPPQAVR